MRGCGPPAPSDHWRVPIETRNRQPQHIPIRLPGDSGLRFGFAQSIERYDMQRAAIGHIESIALRMSAVKKIPAPVADVGRPFKEAPVRCILRRRESLG